MELFQLYYFQALAEGATLTKTAEMLHITPPALSRSIKNLEDELGVQLFDRNARSMAINEYGKAFLSYVNEALTLLDNGKRMLEDTVCSNQQVHICNMGFVLFFDMTNDFQTMHPEIMVSRQYESLSKFSIDSLLTKYDCVITSPDDLQNSNLSYHVLYDDAYPVLIVSPSHPLSHRRSIRLSEVKDEMFILPPETETAGKYIYSIFQKAGFYPERTRVCESIIRERLAYDNAGVTIGTAHSALELFRPQLVCIPITDPIMPNRQAIIVHASRFQSQAMKSFIRFATNYYSSGWNSPVMEMYSESASTRLPNTVIQHDPPHNSRDHSTR